MSYQAENRTALVQGGKFVSAYSEKLKVALTFPEHSPHTRQEFADECNINLIMSRYQRTGELPALNLSAPQYLDVTGVDFREQMEFIAGAQSMFEELPSAIRNRFANDPAQFLDFCSNEGNRVELAKMGLLSEEATRAALLPPSPPNTPPRSSEAVPEPSST